MVLHRVFADDQPRGDLLIGPPLGNQGKHFLFPARQGLCINRRGRIGAAVLYVLLSLYVSLIADLNRPTSGNIRESQEAMLMLQASLKSQPPPIFDSYRSTVVE